MKWFHVYLAVLLLLCALCACTAQQAGTAPLEADTDSAQTGIGSVMFDNQVYTIPEETTGIALDEDQMKDATLLTSGQTPSKNGDVSLLEDPEGKRVQICPVENGDFLVIVDGQQHLIER